MEIRTFRESDRAEVIELWQACDLVRPQNDPDRDIDRKLAVDDAMFFIAEVDGGIVGTVMAGYDGHRGWINYLAVTPSRRSEGVGAALMRHAENRLRSIGCPKVNLQVRRSNAGAAEFYHSVGYRADDVVSLGKRLVDDDPVSEPA